MMMEAPVRSIAREKEIKGWKRLRKISLIESRNPTWEDLAKNWFLLSPNPLVKHARSVVILSERARASEGPASRNRGLV